VLFLGRVTFQKGPLYFLEAAARVVPVRPDVRFVMCGSGDLLPEMVERAAEMGLARHVRFTGFLSGPDVERMLARADVYVMPSVSEPFGIAPLEAMRQDVPVIISRQSGVAEVLSSALKVDFWDVEDLASKILAVLDRPALRTTLAEEGRTEVDSMRWDSRAQAVRRVYEEVAA
jgi:glycogen synthase